MSNSKEIAQNIRNAAQLDIPKAIEDALNKVCLIVANDAKSRAPVQTGALRNSIQIKVQKNEGVIGTNLHYAPYVEIGTGIHSSMGNGRQGGWVYYDANGERHFTMGSHPKPYLKPALDSNISAILKCFEGII
jgi:HK97 gp10 family phage protein